jgi:predicted ATPase
MAVFLRLSPIGIAQGSRPTRKSFEPMLDQQGMLLPALLNEFPEERMKDLVGALQRVMPDIRGVKVSSAGKRQDEVHFSLLERMPYKGRTGRRSFPIPAWMLSEGTLRLTAILALLYHERPPSLLCIEEIENGLDPWTAIAVIRELRSAADRGIQVVVTTHSPWLLDHVEVQDILYVERVEGETVYTRFADREKVKHYQEIAPPGGIYVSEG